MVEISNKTQSTLKADPNELLLAEAEVREKDPKTPQRQKTTGEVFFNRGVYTGIGFALNEASTLVFADEFQFGVGKKYFESLSNWMVKAFNFKDVVKDGKLIPAQKNAANMLLYASLLTTGTALVGCIKLLEDNKGYCVQKSNHFFDRQKTSFSPEQSDARDEEVRRAMACESKQTWPSMIIGRIAAIGAVLGVGKLMGTKRTESFLAGSEKLLTGSIQPGNMAQKTRLHRYAALIGLETMTCATSSIVLEIASKLFAKRGITVRDPELCTQLVHEQPPAAPQNDSDNDTKSLTAFRDNVKSFKARPIVAALSHVDAIKASETNYGLAT